jgi:hypothetical protein
MERRKKIHIVDDICFIIIHQDIVKQLQLQDGDVWADECIVDNGIMLAICRRGEKSGG